MDCRHPRRLLASLALALLAPGCVLWPAGTGPGAEPMPLAEAVERRDRGEVVLVDLRSRLEYAAGHLGGAVNVPLDEVEQRVEQIRRLGKLPVLYCG